MSQEQKKQVEVAVGVILQQGQVLLAWRSAMLDQGDCYEFPGGKVEPSETPREALARELKEEIDIEVLHATRLSQIVHDYPSKSVCLHVFVVSAFAGQPHGLQGQALRWVALGELATLPLPKANEQIVRQLCLPEYYAIMPELPEGHVISKKALAVYPMATMLYVRQPALSADAYVGIVKQLRKLRPDLRLVIAVQHLAACKLAIEDWVLWCSAVHYTSAELARLANGQGQGMVVLGNTMIRIAAVHNDAQLQLANLLAMDAVTISPVKATATHPDATLLGWQGLQRLAAAAHMPVYALGGMALADLATAKKHGAYGLAGIGMFTEPEGIYLLEKQKI